MISPIPVLSDIVLHDLNSIVGTEFASSKIADREHHSLDQSFHEPHLPAVVVWPENTQQVSAILNYANNNLIPITPWGAGTSVEGNSIPVFGGIVLDLSRMDRLLKLYAEDFQVDVEAGIKYKDMNAKLAQHGLFFAPDPGANASIGGMVANNAAGTRTPGYGATKDNVLRLEVVLASGEIIRTGTRSPKTSSGYDLVHLFVGSEGTLGIVTQATLKLVPIPDQFSAVIAVFESNSAASDTVADIKGSALRAVALEFLTPPLIRELNTTGEFHLQERPTLLMEFHSSSDVALEQELAQVEAICREHDCVGFEAGVGRAERDRLWKLRHSAYEVIRRNHPGVAYLSLDVAAPVSKYPELVAACDRVMQKYGLEGFLFGHAGDGNLHPSIPFTPDNAASEAIAKQASAEMVYAALELDGTSTGEHGVGLGKIQFMPREHGASLQVMRDLKQTLDPNGILNPGKMF